MALLRKPYFASEALVEQFQGTPGRYHLGDGAPWWLRVPGSPVHLDASVAPVYRLSAQDLIVGVTGWSGHPKTTLPVRMGFSGHLPSCPSCPPGCALHPFGG